MPEKLAMQQNDKPISAIEFSPLGESDTALPGRNFLRPAPVAILAGLIFSLLALWFLMTAKSVVIEVDPPEAELSISGGLMLNLAGNTLMRPGDYRLTAEFEGYHTLQQTFHVGEQVHQALHLSLRKKPGKLTVSAATDGVQVSVDNTPAGTVPLTITDLEPGEHNLLFNKPRFFPEQRTVTIAGLDKTQTLFVTLRPAWGNVTLASSPPGAEVLVAGEVRGKTPLTTNILQSGELVSIKLAGHKRWQQRLQVNAGESIALPDIQLQPADGLVQLNSTPSGASITVDGQFAGSTPMELQLQPDKNHQLVLFLDGYQNLRQQLTVRAGEERILNLKLTASVGNILITGQPADAEVWVNGTRLGIAGQSLKLPARAHHIELRKPGYASQRKTITPKPGIDQVVRYHLMTEKQARWANTPRQITGPAGIQLKLFRPEVTFSMGTSRRKPGRRANEVMRDVRLERAFYLAEKEVTNDQFKQFLRQHSSRHANGKTLDGINQPVTHISWQQAALYCNWLSEQAELPPFYQIADGKVVAHNKASNGYRLPTEAEWSWAARWTSQGMAQFPWSGEFPPTGKAGNYADVSAATIVGRIINTYNDGATATADVGSYPANNKGLYDLGGNVAEWVHDYYGIDFNLDGKANIDPLGPETGEFRVIRGSSWRHGTLTELRLSFRDYGIDARDDVGFRVARYAE
ncbi:MAG: PEGA domain-containing protein [Porticoccaceae bacterium]|nr:PEGA domain-containing protein [Pseudomonadales bacterium]MCP5173405.1 PEGA domain-containing protein [Pseudomonadales bacterium]MCP5303217.1 PEGA domain-containing protein [Pseudomonadales bacterium]